MHTAQRITLNQKWLKQGPIQSGTWFSFFWVALLVYAPAHDPAYAMTEQDYLQALSIAQKKVERSHPSNTSEALSSAIVKAYLGRYYRVGDTWDVAAWELKNPLMSLVPIPEGATPESQKTGRGGVFHYEVKAVRTGAHPEVIVEIKQLAAFGLQPVDPQVEELTLTFSDQWIQSEKSYQLKNHPEKIKVSPDGLHSRITPLELFPLDVPPIATAIHHPASTLPPLPKTIESLGAQMGYHPNLKQCTWLEQDDFFGRPIEILWQYGTPWPSYLRTSNGVAILIRSVTT